MTLPLKYDPAAVENEFRRLKQRLDDMYTVLHLVPRSSAPLDPKDGYLAVSDGTGSGFDGSSGAGLYRYSGSAWIHLG